MNDVMRALADSTRRQLLLALLEHNPQSDFPLYLPEDTPFEEVEAHRVALYHRHLPMLDDLGFIEWDEEAHEVVKGPRFDDLRPFLDPEDDAPNFIDTGDTRERGRP